MTGLKLAIYTDRLFTQIFNPYLNDLILHCNYIVRRGVFGPGSDIKRSKYGSYNGTILVHTILQLLKD